MSLGPIWVRARDGALYKNPLLVFPEGFVCFDEDEDPEVVLWLEPDNLEGPPRVDLVGVLRRVFGFGAGDDCSANVDSVGYRGRAQRVVPQTDPWVFRPAISYYFKLVARVPRPQVHDGSEVRATRVQGTVLDLPPHVLDAYALEMPD